MDPSLRSIARILTDAAPRAEPARRAEIWLLASRFAEYTGWMAQEGNNAAEALRWTDLAVRWGANGGDGTVAAYALVRRAFIAEHRGDAAAVLRLAGEAAVHPAATPLIRAHAARREAQAYAALGDHGACREALERCRGHAGEDDRRDARWGPRIENGDPRLIEASCMIGLRRFEQAAELFALELEQRPAARLDANSRARFTIRQATALAGSGRLDQACRLIGAVMPTVRSLDSATVRAELHRFTDQARTGRATSGQRELVEAAAAVADGRRPVRGGRR